MARRGRGPTPTAPGDGGRPPGRVKGRPAGRAATLPPAGAGLRVFQPQFGSGITTVRHAGHQAENVILEGDPPSFDKIWNLDLARGRWFNQTDEEHRRLVVVLGHDTAKTLFPDPGDDPVGQEVTIKGHVFTVVGVAARSKQISFGGSNPEDNKAMMPLSAMEKLYPANRDYVLFAKADSAGNVTQVSEEIRELLRRKRRRIVLGEALRGFAGDDGARRTAVEDKARAERGAEDPRLRDQRQHLSGCPTVERRWLRRDQCEVGREERRAQQGGDARRTVDDDVVGMSGELRRLAMQRVAR